MTTTKRAPVRLELDEHYIAVIHSDGRVAIGRIEGKHVSAALVLSIPAANLLADAIRQDRLLQRKCRIEDCAACDTQAPCGLQPGEAYITAHMP